MDYRPFQGWVLSHPPLLTQNTVVSLYSFLVTRGMIARTSRRFSILVKGILQFPKRTRRCLSWDSDRSESADFFFSFFPDKAPFIETPRIWGF